LLWKMRAFSAVVGASLLSSIAGYWASPGRSWDLKVKSRSSRFNRQRQRLESTEGNDASGPGIDTMKRLTELRSFNSIVIDKVIEAVDDVIFDSWKHNSESVPHSGVKERVVILGSGWGAHAFVSSLDASRYDATVISPRNYFLFTPMLAGAAVGTVEYRSITQPIRDANPQVDYLEATCKDVDVEKKEVACEIVVCQGTSCEIKDFNVPYDHLIIGVGASTNTFGIPGVREHCNFLKQIEDAAQLRNGIGNCFERANIPGLTDLQKQETLTFAVIGAGPTGVEFVAELCDFIEQDVPEVYPQLLPFVRVKLIEASNKVLMAFDGELQEKAIETLQARCVSGAGNVGLVEVLLKAGVKEVTSDSVILTDDTRIRYGLSVWAAGNGPVPLVLDLTKRIEEQNALQGMARGRLVVDSWLRVKGVNDGSMWSLGDCAFVEGASYPATAQVAAQQGSFLARIFSRNYNLAAPAPPRILEGGDKVGIAQTLAGLDKDVGGYAKGFQFLNLGILAYLGDSKALAQIQVADATIKGSGITGFALWRSVYLSKQVSWRNRLLVAIDWAKSRTFGRDLTRL